MKKFIISMCVALTALCASAQQTGDMAVGVNLGVAPSLQSGMSVTNFGIGAKFQYNVTTPIRLEADLDYWFKSSGVDVFDITANVHYLFNITDKIKVYPLVGIGYAHSGIGVTIEVDEDLKDLMEKYEEESENTSSSASNFLFNVGAGAEYALNDKLSVGAEIKYQYIKNFNRLPITIGVTYKF